MEHVSGKYEIPNTSFVTRNPEIGIGSVTYTQCDPEYLRDDSR